MLNREKVVNWWVGRMSDQDLAEWTGMAPRAVGIVLNLPYLRGGVSGGGRGSKNTRRIAPQSRNSVPIIHALNVGGVPFELAANIIAATPVLASFPTRVVDWSPALQGVAPLMMVDPGGNWQMTDMVPENIWNRFVYLCYDVNNPKPTVGDLFQVPCEEFKENTGRGTMIVDRSSINKPNAELKPISDKPVYDGEIDLIGLYAYENFVSEAFENLDDHILIVNGMWVFHKRPDPRPERAIFDFAAGERKPVKYDYEPISVIERDKKTVRSIGFGRDDEEQERARYHLKNFDSLLDVNITLAVRKMKRRAYGLPTEKPANPIPFSARLKDAQDYAAKLLSKKASDTS